MGEGWGEGSSGANLSAGAGQHRVRSGAHGRACNARCSDHGADCQPGGADCDRRDRVDDGDHGAALQAKCRKSGGKPKRLR